MNGLPSVRRNSSDVQGTLAITESTAERYTLADPDVRLMLRVRDDDARAFEELMLRYQTRLVSLLAHLTGQPDVAEDLAQDVFLRDIPGAEALRTGGEVFDVAVYDRGERRGERAAEPCPPARGQLAPFDQRYELDAD